jgi:AcrR family transcriptional regulator
LRERQLRSGPGTDRETVETNQRERLYGTTVAVVAAKGYAKSSVGKVIALAGVSRTTFYKYFADKRALFLATAEALLAGVVAVTRAGSGATWEARAEHGMRGFVELVVAQPDAARLCLVESHAAGSEATALVDAAAERFTEMALAVSEEPPAQRGMPRGSPRRSSADGGRSSTRASTATRRASSPRWSRAWSSWPWPTDRRERIERATIQAKKPLLAMAPLSIPHGAGAAPRARGGLRVRDGVSVGPGDRAGGLRADDVGEDRPVTDHHPGAGCHG